MNKKGFTLIELLAVIIVLSVILSIAVTRVMNVIGESRKEVFRISSETLVKEAQRVYIMDNFNISNNEKTYSILNNAFVGDSFDIGGELPDSGNIYINKNGDVSVSLIKDNYCAFKSFDDKEILIGNNIASCTTSIPEVVLDSCFYYTSTATEVTITDYDIGCSRNVIIPSVLGGLPVKVIGDLAFNAKNLSSVMIPNSVTSIEFGAFAGNLLTSVTIPEGVTSVKMWAFMYNQLISVNLPSTLETIENSAFSDNYIVSLVIPNGVTTIEFDAFSRNQLASLSLPNTITRMDNFAFNNNLLPDNQAFIYKRNLDGSEDKTTVISYGGARTENVTIPSSVTTIGEYSFSSSNIESLILPSNLLVIEYEAFKYNRINSLTIPASITTIASRAFYSNSISNLSLPLKNINYSTVFNDNLLPDNQAFIYKRNINGSEDKTTVVSYGGVNRSNVVIPSTVTTIGNYSFDSNYITGVVIPNTVTTIKEGAFLINSLTNLVIPNSVTTIEDYAFQFNELANLTITNSLTNIGWTVFSDNLLTNVIIPSNVTMQNDSISSTFYTAYVTNNARASGTYTAPSQDGVWTKQ